MKKIKHIVAGYEAEIIKEFKNGKVLLNIPDSAINRLYWRDSAHHLPFQITAYHLKQYFIKIQNFS